MAKQKKKDKTKQDKKQTKRAQHKAKSIQHIYTKELKNEVLVVVKCQKKNFA